MPEKKSMRRTGQRRRELASLPYTVEYFSQKHGISRAEAAAIVEKYGPDRHGANAAARFLKRDKGHAALREAQA